MVVTNDTFGKANMMAGRWALGFGVAAAAFVSAATAWAGLTPQQAARIDSDIEAAIAAYQTPSASVAVVKDGEIVYAKAFGLGQITPKVGATSDTRYQIASVSKAFTAAAVLALVDDGKLSLDDTVSKWFPELTSADKITVRHLIAHTSGYSDYWPQDYVMDFVSRPTTPHAVMERYAKAPLDYQPGEDWQYSNTGYVVAGQIVEKVTGQSLHRFMEERVLKRAGITDAVDASATDLSPPDALGYQRQGLGPNRLTPKAGHGWPYAAWPLALTASDVAKFDMTVINRSLLSPKGHDVQIETIKLNSGKDTGYAMGWFVRKEGDRTLVNHGGEGAGYLTENRIYLEDGVAIVVLTNTMTGGAHAEIADRIAFDLVPPKGMDARVLNLFIALQKGQADRAAFSDSFNIYLTDQALADHRDFLGALGAPVTLQLVRSGKRGGMEMRSYRLRLEGGKTVTLSVYVTKDGKIDQFLVYPVV